MKYGHWYPEGKCFSITIFTIVDWVGDVEDENNTRDGDLFIIELLVLWLSEKKTSISLSTIEVEYIVVTSCCTQLLWTNHTLQNVKVVYGHPIHIICDNTSSNIMSINLVFHSKTKHIPIKYHFLKK